LPFPLFGPLTRFKATIISFWLGFIPVLVS
jgi:hypothetical protein